MNTQVIESVVSNVAPVVAFVQAMSLIAVSAIAAALVKA